MKEIEEYTELFKAKYGIGNEVEVPIPVMTIKDDYPSTFCSGTNGYINKLRINKDTHKLEYYHDWWCYGWFTDDYQEQVLAALKQAIAI